MTMKKEEFIQLIDSMPISASLINTMAISEGFQVRKGAVSPVDFLYSVCCLSVEGTVSFNDMAARLDAGTTASVSRQAIAKKMGKASCAGFLKKILALAIAGRIGPREAGRLRGEGGFGRILVQDSTIVKLPARLFGLYSGVSNGSSSVCNARVQCVYDLLAENFVSFDITSYSVNDLAAAPGLALRKGDLVIRDRGYLSSAEVERHLLAGADCIFRHKQGMVFLDPATGGRVDLLGLLRKFGQLEMTVSLNDKNRTAVRVTALPVTEELANIRRMKAKKENKKTPDPGYLEMLGWSVFITTIPPQKAGYAFIYKAYCLRWRIEIIFKSWKSSLAFSKIHTVSQNQLSIILYARFIMIIICIQYIFSPARKMTAGKSAKGLSMLKVVRYLMKNPAKMSGLMKAIKNKECQCREIKALEKYCSYEKRKRTNFEEDIENIKWP